MKSLRKALGGVVVKRLATWIMILGLTQYMVDKFMFPLAGASLPTDFYQLYEPRRKLEQELAASGDALRSRNLYKRLAFTSAPKTINIEYIEDLLAYHEGILNVFHIYRDIWGQIKNLLAASSFA
jgi:hypothetical protein